MQYDMPTLLNVPGKQSWHLDDPSLLKVPAGQRVHDDCLLRENDPAAQVRHRREVLGNSLNVPAAQVSHFVARPDVDWSVLVKPFSRSE